jgi:hypothetical protein
MHYDGIMLCFGVCLITKKYKTVDIREFSDKQTDRNDIADGLQGKPRVRLGFTEVDMLRTAH